MTRVKKTRKTGPLAAAKKPLKDWEKPQTKPASNKPPHKTKGHKPGSRFNPLTGARRNTMGAGVDTRQQDPRHGSKKPLTLLQPSELEAQQQPQFDRQAALAELNAIENDQKLQQLLDRADAGDALSQNDARYVDERTERFAQLADLLGIELDDDDFDDLDVDEDEHE